VFALPALSPDPYGGSGSRARPFVVVARAAAPHGGGRDSPPGRQSAPQVPSRSARPDHRSRRARTLSILSSQFDSIRRRGRAPPRSFGARIRESRTPSTLRAFPGARRRVPQPILYLDLTTSCPRTSPCYHGHTAACEFRSNALALPRHTESISGDASRRYKLSPTGRHQQYPQERSPSAPRGFMAGRRKGSLSSDALAAGDSRPDARHLVSRTALSRLFRQMNSELLRGRALRVSSRTARCCWPLLVLAMWMERFQVTSRDDEIWVRAGAGFLGPSLREAAARGHDVLASTTTSLEPRELGPLMRNPLFEAIPTTSPFRCT